MSRITKVIQHFIYNTIILHTRANIVICGHTQSDYSSMLHQKGKESPLTMKS